jgi:hypothetical protein
VAGGGIGDAAGARGGAADASGPGLVAVLDAAADEAVAAGREPAGDAAVGVVGVTVVALLVALDQAVATDRGVD